MNTDFSHARRPFAGLLVLPLLTACSGGGSDPAPPTSAFTYSSVLDERFAIVVSADGTPLPLARVQISSHLDANAMSGEMPIVSETFAMGFTDEFGRFEASMHLPTRFQSVDVVVNKRGHAGPYSEEALRDEWGHHAPSSRIHVAREDLDEVQVALWEGAQ